MLCLALLGHTMCDLSMRRCNAIKPNLHRDYSSLCAAHVPITSYLFGDNLQTQLSDIRASNKISKSTVPQRYEKPRPQGRSGTWGTSTFNSEEGKQRRGHFLSNSRQWKQYPPRTTFQAKKHQIAKRQLNK